MSAIRILIAAEDPLARAGLAALLAEDERVTVTGQVAPDSPTLMTWTPDAVLWDLGWDAGARAGRLADVPLAEAGLPVVALLPDDTLAAEVGALLGAGDEGPLPYALLARTAPRETLVAALGAVAAGLVAQDPAFGPLTAGRAAYDGPPDAEPLTAREGEVLALLAEGLPNKQIALRLNISEHTVKFHVNAIMGKLGAASRTEAVIRATRRGLVAL